MSLGKNPDRMKPVPRDESAAFLLREKDGVTIEVPRYLVDETIARGGFKEVEKPKDTKVEKPKEELKDTKVEK